MYYLYVKKHQITNLKYLGYTRSKNPVSYRGSGIYWSSHIKKHGYKVETSILLETEDLNEIRAQGLYYSQLWNVVESQEWANLKPESGDGGFIPGFKQSRETIEKSAKKRRGAQRTAEQKDRIRQGLMSAGISRKGVALKDSTKQKISDANTGKKRTLEQRIKIVDGRKDRGWSEESINKRTATRRLKSAEIYSKVSAANKGQTRTAEVKEKMSKRRKELMTDEKRANYSNSRLGTKNPSWKGYIQTPDGVYESTAAAARYYGCTDKTVLNRLRSTDPKFIDWVRLDLNYSPAGIEIYK